MDNQTKKICPKCGNEKDIVEFHKNKNRVDRLSCYCKTCKHQLDKDYCGENKEKLNHLAKLYYKEHQNEIKERVKRYRIKNKEKIKEYRRKNKGEIKQYQDAYNKQYCIKNKNKLRNKKKEFRLKNPEIVRRWKKEYYERHKDQIIENMLQYYIKNRDKKIRYIREYYAKNKHGKIKLYRKKHHSRIEYKIIHNIRNRVYKVLNGKRKTKHTIELLGCSVKEFREYIEKQFKCGMTWNNYGMGDGKWNLDHIIPCAFFNIIDPIEQQQCFHFTNHQPLWERGIGGNNEKRDKTHGLKLLYNNLTPFLSLKEVKTNV